MCGLCGYINVKGTNETDNITILEMLALQKHRGPDDSGVVSISRSFNTIEDISTNQKGIFSSPSDILFGFNRLSILDLSINGHQPMISPNRDVVLMMNGEIYNAFNYKSELEKRGYVFKSTSDTEVVLYLYLEFGIEEMLKRLNGMFALAIYDARSKMLFLARDRFGIKPLYILKDANRIAFSSELKSFKALKNFQFTLNEDALNEFLLFRNVINNTLFKNITNCTPGTFISINFSGEVRQNIYYKVNDEGNCIFNLEESEYQLGNSLQMSVEAQLLSDVKLGSQLSGGVDSSIVTYYANKGAQKGKLETISIIFDNVQYSEEPYIDYVAKEIDLSSHKYRLTTDYYFSKIEDATWHFEHPLNHPNTIGIYLLSQKAKEHVTVLLSGEGADELLGGYNRFIHSMYPYSIRKFLGAFLQNCKNIDEFIKYFATLEGRVIMGSSFGNISTTKHLKKDFSFNTAIQNRREIFKKLDGSAFLKHRKYEILTYLPDLLIRQDKMSMAHSIENRVPFLDNQMAKVSLSIADKLLINRISGKVENKILLKKICAKNFSKNFAFRKKMGFGIPLKQFFLTESFIEKWEEKIKRKIIERGIFDISSLNNVHKLNNIASNQIEALWLMSSFEIWAQQYLD